jgi:hypothetical protein
MHKVPQNVTISLGYFVFSKKSQKASKSSQNCKKFAKSGHSGFKPGYE